MSCRSRERRCSTGRDRPSARATGRLSAPTRPQSSSPPKIASRSPGRGLGRANEKPLARHKPWTGAARARQAPTVGERRGHHPRPRPRTVVRPQNVVTANSTELSASSTGEGVGAAALCSISVAVIASPLVDLRDERSRRALLVRCQPFGPCCQGSRLLPWARRALPSPRPDTRAVAVHPVRYEGLDDGGRIILGGRGPLEG
jgi:hypothetical protein